jgi:hypothetical protein
VLPCSVFVILPSSSHRLPQIAPSLSPLRSAPSAIGVYPDRVGALKSQRNASSQLPHPAKQPTHHPLFPHPVNMAHTEKPANPFSSTIYFTLLCIPGIGRTSNPIRSMSLPGELRSPPTTPLDATLRENQGGSTEPCAAALLTIHYSPPTTHFPHHSATLSLRGTP